MYPNWLPAPIELRGGSITQDYSTLHNVFNRTVIGTELKIEGKEIIFNLDPDREMPHYEGGFIHLVTRKDGSGIRTIDYQRASKLHWVPAIIANYNQQEVRSFWYSSAKGEVLYLWLHEHDHIVILKWTSRSRHRKIVVTSFCIDSHNRDYYERLYSRALRVL